MNRRTVPASMATALLALCLVAAGCGSSGEQSSAAETGATSTTAAATDTTPESTAASATTLAPSTTTAPTTTAAPVGPIPAEATYGVERTENISYGTGALRNGEKDLLLDLYVPVDAPGPHPTLVFIHGGSFQTGSHQQDNVIDWSTRLAERGFVVVAPTYRVQPDDPIASARVGAIQEAVGGADGPGLARAIAAAVEDGLEAADWLAARRDELDLDAERMVIGGSSAGAITANHIAYLADDFEFDSLDYAAVIDLWGGFTLAKPSEAVSADDPPVFIVHGTDDDVVSYKFTEDFVAAAEAVGLPYELHAVEGAGHGVAITSVEDADGVLYFDHLVRWLRATLYPEV